jgi:hypothetical protein
MYPSGRWRGHWEQACWGRQAMRELALHFAEGRVSGKGVDVIGPFTFAGEYDDRGNVVLVKQYVGRHQVLYRGRYDGEGTIHGQWTIGEDWRGPFALSPEGHHADADAPILAVTATPPRPRDHRIIPAPRPDALPVAPDEDR